MAKRDLFSFVTLCKEDNDKFFKAMNEQKLRVNIVQVTIVSSVFLFSFFFLFLIHFFILLLYFLLCSASLVLSHFLLSSCLLPPFMLSSCLLSSHPVPFFALFSPTLLFISSHAHISTSHRHPLRWSRPS